MLNGSAEESQTSLTAERLAIDRRLTAPPRTQRPRQLPLQRIALASIRLYCRRGKGAARWGSAVGWCWKFRQDRAVVSFGLVLVDCLCDHGHGEQIVVGRALRWARLSCTRDSRIRFDDAERDGG